MKDIRNFLAQLSKELQRNDDFDIEARQILDDIHKDIDQIEESGGEKVQPTLDRPAVCRSSSSSVMQQYSSCRKLGSWK